MVWLIPLSSVAAGLGPEVGENQSLGALGLELKELFPESPDGRPPGKAPVSPSTQRSGGSTKKTYSNANAALSGLRKRYGQETRQWSYHNAQREPVGVVVRWDRPGGKEIRPLARQPDGSWACAAMPAPRPLYGLPALLKRHGETVYVVEGEKAADAAARCGLLATTSAGGSGAANKSDWTPLAGREVVILPDADAPGRKYAEEVATILSRLSPPAAVRIVELPGLPEGGDIDDWIEARGPMEPKDVAAAIGELTKAAKVFTPPNPDVIEPYHPFPVDCLPEPMRSFVTEAAAAVGCDAAYVALPLLAAAAAAVGNTRRIELKRGWTEPAILWAAVIGESGTLKSPAIDVALRPVRRRQHEAMRQWATETEAHEADMLQYEIDLASWRKSGGQGEAPRKPQAPTQVRYWCDDTTLEALAVLLKDNWRGLLVATDELGGWLGGFDRYVHGGKAGADVAKWLAIHGGRPLMVDRKTGDRRTLYVKRAAVSVVGAIQPSTLSRALGREYFDNGLAARLLLTCPPRRAKRWTEAEIDPETEEAVEMMFDRLYGMAPEMGQDGEPEPRIVGLTPAAKDIWVRFYEEHAQEHTALVGDLSAAWSKLEAYAARLALVIHCVRRTDSLVLDEQSMGAGVTLARWFGHEARRVYDMLRETDEDAERRELVELVRRRGGSITARELMRASWAYAKGEANAAEQALNDLVRAGLGRWEDVPPTAQGGRPTRRFVLSCAH